MNPTRILFASLIGTTIEFFDFYIYAHRRRARVPAAVLPARRSGGRDAAVARDVRARVLRAADRLGALRPLRRPRRPQGDARRRAADDGPVDGGDRPAADLRARSACSRPLLLALCRFGQGLGLGGEWGGAVLLAIENAPPGKRAWYGMFPQLGAPIGFFCSTGVFLAAHRDARPTRSSSRAAGACRSSRARCWCVVGLYVRLKITETPEFERAVANDERVALPLATVLREHFAHGRARHGRRDRDVRHRST